MRNGLSILRCLLGAAVLSAAACTGETPQEQNASEPAPAEPAAQTDQPPQPAGVPAEEAQPQPRDEVTPIAPPTDPTAPTTAMESALDEPPPASPLPIPQRPDENLAALDRNYLRLLVETVSVEGLVRYGLLGGPEYSAGLEWIVRAFADSELPEHPTERLAFLCNAYNANVLAKVVEKRTDPAFTNIGEVEGFFDRDTITVAGEKMTFRQLVDDHIRAAGDPRIHAALCGAASSSPPLRNEPYLAAKLDVQLDEQCRRWINDPQKNRTSEGRLAVSTVFQSYAQDFEAAQYGGVVGFMRMFVDPDNEMAPLLWDEYEPPVTYLPYDWALNAATEPDYPEK